MVIAAIIFLVLSILAGIFAFTTDRRESPRL